MFLSNVGIILWRIAYVASQKYEARKRADATPPSAQA
jgi:hypothetical protein